MARSSETTLNRVPVDICEKRFDIFRPVSRLVIEQKRVFPYVHYQNRVEAGDIPDLMQGYPVIGNPPAFWILKAYRPTDAAHFADADKVRFPDVIAAEAFLSCFIKLSLFARITRSCLCHVSKVVFMQHHAVVLETETASELGVSRHLLLIHTPVL